MIFDSLDTGKQELIKKHLDLVLEKNKQLNLTRIDSFDKGITLHIEDSLLCLPEFSKDDGLFLDIGTGGGFPGIPLAIASGRPGVLIDSVKKKANAVSEIVHELGLDDQLEVLGVRSEEYAQDIGEKFSTVVLRAVSSLSSIVELASPLLVKGGSLIALKGKEDSVTNDEAQSISEKFGLELTSHRSALLDDTYERNIFVFNKVDEPTVQLPRRNGMAQKRPLV